VSAMTDRPLADVGAVAGEAPLRRLEDADGHELQEQSPDLEAVSAWLAESPFFAWLEISVVEIRPDGVTLTMPVVPRQRFISGILHGGLTAMLLDTSLGIAARLATSSSHAVRTKGLDVRYLAPARGNLVTTIGHAAWSDTGLEARGEVCSDGVVVAEAVGHFVPVLRRSRRSAPPAVGGALCRL
jgi:uncharacterized protein (TIGR00369 family)